MNFSLILAVKFLRIENLKYDKIFQLTHCFLVNALLFVRTEQKIKAEVRKQQFKCVP